MLRLRQPVTVCRPKDLPPQAAREKEALNRLGIRSPISLPLVSAGQIRGVLTLASLRHKHAWPPDVVERLQVCADVVANALARTQPALQTALGQNEERRRQLEAENLYLREEVEEADQVADTNTPVLLVGERGTGKELLAHAIHARSRRRQRALIAVNRAALPATLVESELFGHERGAFTGAAAAKPGRFELADGGTLFLDEIGELDPAVQAKLLRELQNVVERALILSRGPVLRVEEALGVATAGADGVEGGSSEALRDVERAHVLQVLERCKWTVEGPGQAAERLGLKPSTLRNRMKKLGLARPG